VAVPGHGVDFRLDDGDVAFFNFKKTLEKGAVFGFQLGHQFLVEGAGLALEFQGLLQKIDFGLGYRTRLRLLGGLLGSGLHQGSGGQQALELGDLDDARGLPLLQPGLKVFHVPLFFPSQNRENPLSDRIRGLPRAIRVVVPHSVFVFDGGAEGILQKHGLDPPSRP